MFVIGWGGIIYSYYPHYNKNKSEIEMTEVIDFSQIKVMSYNITSTKKHIITKFDKSS